MNKILHIFLKVCIPITLLFLHQPADAAESEEHFVYRVQMSPYGNIGVYRNSIETNGDEKTITTDAQIKVSLLGIVLYRLNISRIEREIGNRIVYFHGLTTENGKAELVDGKAVGNNFVITSPNGSITAPGTIRASDPWSAMASDTKVIFMPDTGAVVGVHTSGGERMELATDSARPIWVNHYRIDTVDGTEKYELWVDEQRIPIKFSIADGGGTTIFTLTR